MITDTIKYRVIHGLINTDEARDALEQRLNELGAEGLFVRSFNVNYPSVYILLDRITFAEDLDV